MVVNENCTNPPLMNLAKSLLPKLIKDKRALTHRLEIYIRKTISFAQPFSDGYYEIQHQKCKYQFNNEV